MRCAPPFSDAEIEASIAEGCVRLEGAFPTELTAPRVVDQDTAWRELGEGVRRPPRLLRIDEYLRMDAAPA